MTREEHHTLLQIATDKPWFASKNLKEYLATITPENPPEAKNEPETRTGAQHRALFLWFSQIEHICTNEGVTWNAVMKHTHDVAVTKEGLHAMCKVLMKALFGTDSTKELKKQGQLDKIIDHFIALFAKEGVELPPFPNDESRVMDRHFTKNTVQYPEYEKAPDFEAQNSI